MKYPDGREAHFGDRVVLFNGEYGTVVFSIDTDEYCDEFPKERWEYLKAGVMVKTDNGALIHYQNPNVDFIQFVEA